MTCIAAYCDDHITVFAADSCASDGTSVETRLEPKCWFDGEWVVATMPSFRVMQILQYDMDFNDLLGAPDECSNRDIIHKLVPELKLRLLTEPSPCTDFQILIGGMGNLWFIDADFAVNEVSDFVAIGSGSEYALGSMYTNIRVGASTPHKVVIEAVLAACQFSNSCTPPVTTRFS